MTETVSKIKEQIDALSDDDRAELLNILFHEEDSILDAPDDGFATQEEFDAELERRAEEIRSGKVVGIPAEEVLARLRKKYT